MVGDYSTVAKEVKKLIGAVPPMRVQADPTGKITDITYEKDWQEGTTHPVEDEHGNIIDYKPDYKNHSLKQDQIKKLDEFIKKALG